MPLYNKDGSVYRLLGPNPAMEEQSTWADFQLHNMKWDSERYKDTMEVVPMQTDLHIKESFVSELEKTKPEVEKPKKEPKHNITIRETATEQPKENLSATTEPQKEEVVERKSVVVPDKKREEEERGEEIDKTFIHCLPATIRTRRDDLYGDVTQTIQYGKPTSFEGVILLQSEMLLNVWTDSDKIGEGSVLYPRNNDKRWWRVKRREKKANGWLLNCLISDYQPSFED
jgi:hypothetical protein